MNIERTKMKQPFEIILVSDVRYEKLVAEICFEKKFVALVSQDEGREKLLLEFPEVGLDEALVLRKVDLASFLAALEASVRRLTGNELRVR